MTRVIVDLSSYVKTALRSGKDTKDGLLVSFEGEEVLVNSAEYGYENFTNMMVKTLTDLRLHPYNVVLVIEGMHAKSKRLLIDSGYKGKRDKKPPEFYVEFQRLRDFVVEQWRSMGAIAVTQDYVEADDVIAFLAKHTEEDIYIATRDNDLAALNTDEGTNEYGAKVTTYIDGLIGVGKLDGEPFVHPSKYLTLAKALVGDSSDSVPGVKNFGKAAFQKLAEQYGYDGLDELIGMLENGSLAPVHELIEDKDHKLLKKIVEAEADAIKCWRLVKLYSQWVHTMQHPLKWLPGKSEPLPEDADARLKHWFTIGELVTTDNYAEVLAHFKQHVPLSPEIAFDIETSTPDESDDWLAAQGDPEGVDQLGSELTGFSFTYGPNMQYTMYVSVDHADTANITMSQARAMMEVAWASGKPIIIQNTFFELSVLSQAKDEDGMSWMERWSGLKWGERSRGFIPNALDTKIEANYVNENTGTGLKQRSKMHLDYEQQTFQQTTQLEGKPDELPKGGRLMQVLEWACPGCGSVGFKASKCVGLCEFCDGTEGGNAPAKAEIAAWEEKMLALLESDPVEYARLTEWKPAKVKRQYKMRELSARHVFGYGCDDTICTAALHNFYKLHMQLDHHYDVYLATEIDAAYQHAKNFIDGIPFSLELSKELEKHDDETFDRAWSTVRDYLMKNGWEGTVPPTYDENISAADIKEAFRIVTGAANEAPTISLEEGTVGEDDEAAESSGEEAEGAEKDPFLATKVRTPAKLVVLARELGHELFAGMVERALNGEHDRFTLWVREHFTGEPVFKASNKQMIKLLYEAMKLPVRVRNKPTKIMRQKGLPGNPKGDALALEYALRECTEEQAAVLRGIKLMRMVITRRSLYYTKYPYFMHWKTGRIHPTHNQSSTNTRRASESKPNKQQLPKHPKITGEPARFRETIVPHREDAVIVSLDEDSQELRIIADWSKDENLVACYVGENKKDVHALTGYSITQLKKLDWAMKLTYPEFQKLSKSKADDPIVKLCTEFRALGKKVNFTTEFGAMAPKLAMTMLVTESEAQTYIDAKERNFPGVRRWKDATIEEAKRTGIVRTLDGGVRHLRDLIMSDDHWVRSKAERQAVNFKVQGSAGQMIKRAEGAMWRMGLVYKYDCVCFGPIHDEVVFSVRRDQLADFLRDAHACMTQPYGNMTIPIVSSISFGPSFGEQYEIGAEPTQAAIDDGFKQWREAHEAKAAKAAAANDNQAAVAA
jgi:5'-3' exonuclease